MHDVENENDVKIESAVVNGHHHDHRIETSLRGAQRNGHENVSPLCAE